MAKLRAGLIGLGMMGRHHARVLRSLDGVELVAIADPGGDPHSVANGMEVLPDVEALIAVGVDYCMVAVPTAFHDELGLTLAAAGVHTMIEKPLAKDVESAKKLAEAFEQATKETDRMKASIEAANKAAVKLDEVDLSSVFQATKK
jgi:predicted dehydrogenase